MLCPFLMRRGRRKKECSSSSGKNQVCMMFETVVGLIEASVMYIYVVTIFVISNITFSVKKKGGVGGVGGILSVFLSFLRLFCSVLDLLALKRFPVI